MARIIPSYPDPTSPTPISNAYAWIAGINFWGVDGTGTVTVWVHRDVAGAYAVPIAQPVEVVHVALGEVLVPGEPPLAFPMLQTIVAEAGAAQQAAAAQGQALDPYSAIKDVLEAHLRDHPKFAGATTYVVHESPGLPGDPIGGSAK